MLEHFLREGRSRKHFRYLCRSVTGYEGYHKSMRSMEEALGQYDAAWRNKHTASNCVETWLCVVRSVIVCCGGAVDV